MRTCFLQTPRLYFSHWTWDDLPLARSLWGDPAVAQYICARGVFTEEEIRARLELEIANQQDPGVQYWPVFSRPEEAFVGCCGLRPAGEAGVYELGFHLRPPFWGQGLAAEAARAVMAYAREVLQARALEAGHNPDNLPSCRVLTQKLGFIRTGEAYYPPTGRMHPTYRLPL